MVAYHCHFQPSFFHSFKLIFFIFITDSLHWHLYAKLNYCGERFNLYVKNANWKLQNYISSTKRSSDVFYPHQSSQQNSSYSWWPLLNHTSENLFFLTGLVMNLYNSSLDNTTQIMTDFIINLDVLQMGIICIDFSAIFHSMIILFENTVIKLYASSPRSRAASGISMTRILTFS